jgi:hypothetical protein
MNTIINNNAPMQRRLKFSLLVLISQILLIAMAISWLVDMIIIAVSGSVYFVENNHAILWAEIIMSTLITVFAICILLIQIKKMGERRSNDRRRGTDTTPYPGRLS